MADKYLYNNAGQMTEKAAITTSAGAGDSGKIPALDGSGRFDSTFMPVGIGAETKSITASEDLAAGDFVNVHVSSGTKVRKADASNAYEAMGFVLSSVTSGQAATVYFEGMNTSCSGLTAGTKYFLSGTAGVPTATAPSTAGHIVQKIGVAASATELSFEPNASIVLA